MPAIAANKSARYLLTHRAGTSARPTFALYVPGLCISAVRCVFMLAITVEMQGGAFMPAIVAKTRPEQAR